MASKRNQRRQAERRERKACGHKQRHEEKGSAYAALRAFKRKRGVVAAEGLGVYQCPFCKGWHLGHRVGAGLSEFLNGKL